MRLAISAPGALELRDVMSGAERVFSSEISEIEVRRAARRRAGEAGDEAALRVISQLTIVELDRQARLQAVELMPTTLRSLDAIQIATALGLNLPGVVFVGYDEKCQEAAAAAGLEIASPGL